MQFRQFLIFIACAVSAGPALAGTYSVTDLGILPGGVSSTATAIDNLGEVVGYTTYADGSTQAFYWTQSAGLIGLGGTNTKAYGVNGANVVGVDGDQAFRWTSSTGRVLLDPTNLGQANGVNPSGKVIGDFNVSALTHRALIWSSTNTRSNPFPTVNLTGVALNGLGQYVGITAGTTGYYNNGISATRLNLSTFLPTSLSDNRIVAGSKNGIAAAIDLDTNTFANIGTLADDLTSRALGINPSGTQIVGVSDGHGGFLYDVASTIGTNLTLALDPAYSGWSITSANAITDSGLIAATGTFGGVQHAVLLTVPEPSTLALVAIGALALLTTKPRLRTTLGAR